jgi:hypothetical protein
MLGPARVEPTTAMAVVLIKSRLPKQSRSFSLVIIFLLYLFRFAKIRISVYQHDTEAAVVPDELRTRGLLLSSGVVSPEILEFKSKVGAWGSLVPTYYIHLFRMMEVISGTRH